MKLSPKKKQPASPEGVRLIDPNGGEWPCAVAFQGTDEDGLHQWIATPIGLTRAKAKLLGPSTGWTVKIKVLPGNTTITWRREA
jgi:hypothetical protein